MYNLYFLRFLFRVVVYISIIFMYIFNPEIIRVVPIKEFFTSISFMHVLWVIFMVEMGFHFIDNKVTTLGSQKHREKYYNPVSKKIDRKKLKQEEEITNKRRFLVFFVWVLVTLAIGGLYLLKIIGFKEMMLIVGFFYIADDICILFWCPFQQFFLHNKCCVTCPIFNWDFLMMFAPFVFVKSFYTLSLFAVSLILFFIWDYRSFKYPVRFTETNNLNLRCENCNDHLCKMKRKLKVIK